MKTEKGERQCGDDMGVHSLFNDLILSRIEEEVFTTFILSVCAS